MSVTFQIYDAAHKYGIDSYPITAAQIQHFQQVLGTINDTSHSMQTTNIMFNQVYTGTDGYTSGFTGKTSMSLTSLTSIDLLEVSTYGPNHEPIFGVTGKSTIAINYSTIITDDQIFSGNDKFIGNSYNNQIKGFGGNDQIDGGGGTDTALFSGNKSKYQITNNGTTITVSGPDGTDTLTNVERVQFADRGVAFDTDGASGQAYRLYQAAFNRTPDQGGLGYYFKNMDQGMSLEEVAQHFIDSPEFTKTYGKLDSNKFVTQLYANVLHRAPDASGLAYHVDHLDHAGLSQTQLLVQFSESPENQAALIGNIKGGMEYIV